MHYINQKKYNLRKILTLSNNVNFFLFFQKIISARRIFYSTKKTPQKIFAVTAAQISDFQIALTHHQMALESRKYHYSTQNQKLHRTVS